MSKFLCTVLLLLSLKSLAQVNHSVDIATGTLNVNFPLFTISSGDVSTSCALTYVANGIKVNEDDGWVAQSWVLSGSNYGVFREMRNFPDDYSASGSDARKGWIMGGSRKLCSTNHLLALYKSKAVMDNRGNLEVDIVH